MDSICSRYITLCHKHLHEDLFYEEELAAITYQLYRSCTQIEDARKLMELDLFNYVFKSLENLGKIGILASCSDQQNRETNLTTNMVKYVVNLTYLCSNFTACGEPFIEYLWENFRTHFESFLVLVSSIKHTKALSSFLSMICNCIRINESNINKENKRLNDFLQDRPLCCQIILCKLPKLSTAPSSSSSSSSPSTTHDAIDEWMHIFAYHITSQSKCSCLFQTLASSSTSINENRLVTYEQIIWLHLLNEVLQDNSITASLQPAIFNDSNIPYPSSCSFDSFALHMRDILLKTCYISPANDLPTLLKGEAISSIFIIIQLLGTMLTFSHDNVTLRETLIQTILPLHVDIMSTCDLILRLLSSDFEYSEDLMIAMLRIQDEEHRAETTKIILILLCNITYRAPAAQKRLLESGCLATVLGHCGTNFKNPFSREWALLTVRNACEGNKVNQQFIEDLKPQGVVQDDVMRRHGISVDIDPGSGKFKFKQENNHNC